SVGASAWSFASSSLSPSPCAINAGTHFEALPECPAEARQVIEADIVRHVGYGDIRAFAFQSPRCHFQSTILDERSRCCPEFSEKHLNIARGNPHSLRETVNVKFRVGQ